VGFFANLATKSGISSIADIYTTSGSISTSSTYAYNSMSLIGSAGVGAMGSSATGADTFRDRAWQFLLGGQYSDNPTFKTGTSAIKPGYTYYNATVGLMTLMTMSGNFYPM
jgi:type 1 glutamine amidotransferase